MKEFILHLYYIDWFVICIYFLSMVYVSIAPTVNGNSNEALKGSMTIWIHKCWWLLLLQWPTFCSLKSLLHSLTIISLSPLSPLFWHLKVLWHYWLRVHLPPWGILSFHILAKPKDIKTQPIKKQNPQTKWRLVWKSPLGLQIHAAIKQRMK